ncbi:MAG: restriction endonuclease [Actinomycetia bacterium]|nr:restriction endonuclease [Actinomycetes bacterium]
MEKNLLYYGDNLDVLRRHIKDESIDLVYLDPPFNSNATYNVLFAEQNGTRAAAQIKAFEDTWRWDQQAAREYEETVEHGGQVAKALIAFRTLLGESNMMAYLAMMAPRLVELRRVLRPTGSIYLHCDPTASHYLKVLMDAVFGPDNFGSEIIWKRQSAHSDARYQFPDVSDSILFFARSRRRSFRPQFTRHDPDYVAKFYRFDDNDGRGPYRLGDIASPNPRPLMMYDWLGFPCPAKGWRYQKETMQRLHDEGRIYYPRRPDGSLDTSRRPALKRYLTEQRGSIVTNIWTDIPPLHSAAAERLGYPTQKPVALLERIIQASSNPGDTVLDPFCGCGTTIIAAEKLKRSWIGIDITHLAITLIKNRIYDSFGEEAMPRVIGEPVSVPDAQELAASDPYQFQWWALGLVGARPVEQKKGADQGIDGRLYFHDEAKGKTKQVILSVKAGHTSVAHVRDLRGVLEREQAEIGVLICMEEPTGPMKKETASAGFYHSPGWNTSHPRIQIITVAELLDGTGIDYPSRFGNVTFKKAPRAGTGKEAWLSFEDNPESQ